jgi:hypothetical protein
LLFLKIKLILNVIIKLYKFFTTNGDWGLGIGDWGLGIGPNPQSPIPNKSPIPNINSNKIINHNFKS